MPIPLKLLIIKEDEDDCLSLILQLKHKMIAPEYRCISCPDDLLNALSSTRWDLILADFQLPGFDAFEALRICKAYDSSLPFVFICDSIEEDTAISLIQAGAQDYLQKNDLSRLVPMIIRIIQSSAKQSEESLKLQKRELSWKTTAIQQNQKFEQRGMTDILDHCPLVLFIRQADEKQSVTYVSDNIERLFGYRPQEFTQEGLSYTAILDPEECDRILLDFQNAARSGSPSLTCRYSILDKEGHLKTVEDRTWFRYKPKGEIQYLESIIEDISERIANTPRINGHIAHQGIIENLKEGIMLVDDQGKIIEWNRGLEIITGIPREEVIERFAPDLQESIIPSYQKSGKEDPYREQAQAILDIEPDVARTPYFQKSFIRRDGSERIMESQEFTIDTTNGHITGSIIRDITERKITEEMLKLREQEFRALAENAPDGIQRLDKDLQIIYVNPAMQAIWNIPASEMIGQSIYDVDISSDEREKWIDALKQVFETQEEGIFEFDQPTENALRYFQTRIVPETNSKGNTQTVLCITRDISELKLAQEALKHSEEQYRSMVENINEVIFNLNPNHTITYISPAVTYILGYQPGEMIEKPFVRFVHSADVSRLGLNFSKCMVAKIAPFEFRMLDKNGNIHEMNISVSPRISNEHFLGLSGVITDLTERIKLKQALTDSQKMVEIGTLTAGVAHEIKSPLQIITGISETITQRLKDKDIDTEDMIKQLEIVTRSGWRIANITGSLLNYARAADGEVDMNDLNEIVSDTLLLMEHQLTTWSNIQIITQLQEKLPEFQCDRNKITQVLINLLSNARDAMPDGGEVTIITGFLQRSNRLFLKVSDTGSGIPEEIRSHIFDPFFTTKPFGRGTGLGLAIVSEIIHDHGGSIELENTSKDGTTFLISLPISHTMQRNISASEKFLDLSNSPPRSPTY